VCCYIVEKRRIFLFEEWRGAEYSNPINHLAKVRGKDVSLSFGWSMGGNPMRISLTVFAALLTAGTAALCEPAKDPASPSASPQQQAGEIVLASADLHPTAPRATSPAPAKRRIARITTCRCGDPQVAPANPDD
jgi:hypothetical protein